MFYNGESDVNLPKNRSVMEHYCTFIPYYDESILEAKRTNINFTNKNVYKCFFNFSTIQ
jgi:hypothetical protein